MGHINFNGTVLNGTENVKFDLRCGSNGQFSLISHYKTEIWDGMGELLTSKNFDSLTQSEFLYSLKTFSGDSNWLTPTALSLIILWSGVTTYLLWLVKIISCLCVTYVIDTMFTLAYA